MIGLEFGPFSRCLTATSIVSLSEFKARAAQMLSEMKTTGHAVVQDFQAHQRLQDALLMLKLMVQGEADVQAGRTTTREQGFPDLEARLTPPTHG